MHDSFKGHILQRKVCVYKKDFTKDDTELKESFYANPAAAAFSLPKIRLSQKWSKVT